MLILAGIIIFFIGYYAGRKTPKAKPDIYAKEYGLTNGLMAPKVRR